MVRSKVVGLLLTIQEEVVMGTSEKYIKMCEKANRVINGDDRVFLYDLNTLYFDPDKDKVVTGWQRTYALQIFGSMATNDYANCFPIYRQDQLQEMWKPEGIFMQKCGTLVFWLEQQDLSMHKWSGEQLWLAFVMREKFNKTWNGEDWT